MEFSTLNAMPMNMMANGILLCPFIIHGKTSDRWK